MKIDYSNPVYLEACTTDRQREVLLAYIANNQSVSKAAKVLNTTKGNVGHIVKNIAKRLEHDPSAATGKGPRILVFDIETAPILGYVWGLWNNNVGLNQIHSDWYVLSWAAKWLGDPPDKVMYMDQRHSDNIEDDYPLLGPIWELLNEADIAVTQNGKKFDRKKLNARFIIQGFQPPSSYRHYDTLVMAKKHFGFTSNKLEFMSDKLCKKYKKLKHAKFAGFELWSECLKKNLKAFEEMEKYNRYDVLSLEELFFIMNSWDNAINLAVYYDDYNYRCTCGSMKYKHTGYYYTNAGKYTRYQCSSCGAESRGKLNLLDKDKRKSMHMPTVK